MRSLRWACLKYSQQHEGLGPARVEDLDPDSYRYVVENLQRSPWRDVKDAEGQDLKGPFVFLVPRARFHFDQEGSRRIDTDRRQVLAVELRPYVDDGKQWVMYTDGTCEREAVRQDLVTRARFGDSTDHDRG